MAEEEKPPSYPELGITASLLVHPSVGYWWGRKGIRFSGMYFNEDHQEYHLNFAYVIKETEKAQHSINLLTSWVTGSDPGADYKFATTGIAYSINYTGFFLEVGLARPWKDDLGNLSGDPVVPCGYWGYIYRFKPKRF